MPSCGAWQVLWYVPSPVSTICAPWQSVSWLATTSMGRRSPWCRKPQNAVFHVTVPSGRPQRLVETGMTRDGAAYALRLRPPGWHRTQPMAEELQWLLALRRDTDLVVPEPVPACDGTLIQDISAPDTSEPWQGVLFHWVAGERRTESLTPPDLERVGTCMARLHTHAAAFVTAYPSSTHPARAFL